MVTVEVMAIVGVAKRRQGRSMKRKEKRKRQRRDNAKEEKRGQR